ncbi:MAG: precorrin-8X methylmutase [Thermodesulfobacteriota bacterium]
MNSKAFIHSLYASPLNGEAIEALSFELIDQEARDHQLSEAQWAVVRRMIHATADFGLLESVRFSSGAIESALLALRAARPIYVDSNMIRSGLSMARLQRVSSNYTPDKISCHVADDDVADAARAAGLPRSLFAIRKAQPILHNGIVAIGNAPVALLELNRMIVEEGIKPALILAMPVGFVHVIESKEELMGLHVPFVAVAGRRGGSTLAVSALHALCSLAEQR